MKSILSYLTLSALLAVSHGGAMPTAMLEEAEPVEYATCEEELADAKKLFFSTQKNLEACEYKNEMHVKVSKLYEQNNRVLSSTMKTVTEQDKKAEKKKQKIVASGGEQTWEEQKAKLNEQIADLKEDMSNKAKSHKKKTTKLKEQIESLKSELASLKA